MFCDINSGALQKACASREYYGILIAVAVEQVGPQDHELFAQALFGSRNEAREFS
jgi:hypothetical protein